MPRPFRFGVQAYTAPSRAAWQAKARQIEDLGYTVLTMPDHIGDFFAPALALLSVAEATRLRVGTFVYDNDFRHPVLLANEAATLDLLTDGRLQLGLGAGWRQSEYEQIGLPFDPPGVRLRRLEEALRLLQACFTGQPVHLAGEFYRVEGITGYPRPVQQPHPPLLVGGGGRRILGVAARHADIVSLNPRMLPDGRQDLASATDAATAEKIAWVRQAAGDRFAHLELNLQIHHVAPAASRTAGLEAVARETSLPLEHLRQSPYALAGPRDEMVEQLLALRERFGISYLVVRERYMADFAPVVARLSGR